MLYRKAMVLRHRLEDLGYVPRKATLFHQNNQARTHRTTGQDREYIFGFEHLLNSRINVSF